MIKICFVCTGNTCRSVMAERIMKDKIKKLQISDVKVLSRGIKANGEQISPLAKKTLKKLKVSSANRKSVKLGKTDNTTLYIAMTESLKQFINAKKVTSFKSLVGFDILDPYGQSEEIYYKTALDIENGINKLIEKINLWREL